MGNILGFIMNNFVLWCTTGFVLFWIYIFIKQIFYWRNNKEVSPFFYPLEDKKDYLFAFIFSIAASFLGFIGLFFIIIAIKVIKDESKRSGYFKLKRI
jgi:hypothetical protein